MYHSMGLQCTLSHKYIFILDCQGANIWLNAVIR
jgi:hypothetical protein